MAAKKPAKSADAARKANEKTLKAASAKGSGKVKYQNTIKEARVNTQKDARSMISPYNSKTGKPKPKAQTADQARAMNKVMGNIPKGIDREIKEIKGQRTPKPSTAKVPVKPRGGRGGLGGLNINNLKK